MASSASGIQLATQSAWQQFKLSLAERDADRAEQQARALRSQANAAQREVSRAQDNARSLQVQAGKAEANADQASRGIAAVRTVEDMGTRLSAVYDRVAQVQAVPVETAPSDAVVNAQGQVTGQVVSVAA